MRDRGIMKKALLLLLLSLSSYAIVELDFEFNYDKTRFGEDRQNKNYSRNYGGSVAFYFFNLTAIEFNYAEGKEETIVNHDTSDAENLVISSETSTLESRSYGVGLRQALAGQNSFIVPTFSFGWARQKYTNNATATIVDKSNNDDTTIYKTGDSVYTYDSMFGAFALKLRLTKTMALKGSVKTSFKAGEWNQAKDQMQYMAGLSWIF